MYNWQVFRSALESWCKLGANLVYHRDVCTIRTVHCDRSFCYVSSRTEAKKQLGSVPVGKSRHGWFRYTATPALRSNDSLLTHLPRVYSRVHPCRSTRAFSRVYPSVWVQAVRNAVLCLEHYRILCVIRWKRFFGERRFQHSSCWWDDYHLSITATEGLPICPPVGAVRPIKHNNTDVCGQVINLQFRSTGCL